MYVFKLLYKVYENKWLNFGFTLWFDIFLKNIFPFEANISLKIREKNDLTLIINI